MSNPNVLPFDPFERMQPFDGQQPVVTEAERHLATVAFRSLAQDMVLNNIGSTTRLDGKLHLYPADFAEITTDGSLPDGKRIEAKVREFDVVDGDMVPYIVELCDRVPYGQYMRHARYEIDPKTGFVFRHDTDPTPPAPIKFSSLDLGKQVSKSEQATALAGAMDAFSNVMANRALEKNFGMNDQPVGLSEVQALSDFFAGTSTVSLQ